MQAEVDETRVGHGAKAEKQAAILTPLNGRPKTKGSRSCLLLEQESNPPASTLKGIKGRPWL
jgi:hypothetical protein